MKKIFLSIIAIIFLIQFTANAQYSLNMSRDLNPGIEKRIDSVLAILSLDEKIGQLSQISSGYWWENNGFCSVRDEQKQMVRDGKLGSFLNVFGVKTTREMQKIAIEQSKSKIPLIFGLDVIHGFRTTFPIPLAESCSWDLNLIELSSHIQAIEAFSSGVHWTFNPMVDIARDPRWGRIAEGAGEDPFLGSLIAKARVTGYQKGDANGNFAIAACVKHFAGYGAAEGGRDYNTTEISERTLRDIYLPPFKAGVEAGAMTLMASFNEIEGVPSSANKHLLTDILRNEWNFKGFVVSDWGSIAELIVHGLAADRKSASLKSVKAGLDMDMESGTYNENLKTHVNEGKISTTEVDYLVRNILRVKFQLGLFDNPYKYCNEEFEKTKILSQENLNATLKVAEHSIVLLKNEKNILPLNKSIKKIVVIGELATSSKHPLGSWEQLGDSNKVVTLLEGLRKKFINSEITFVRGFGINDKTITGIEETKVAVINSDLVILTLGEEGHQSGEARSRSTINLPGIQNEFAAEIFKLGKPVVVVLMNGRPLAITKVAEKADAILETWFLGLQSGTAIANVIAGDYNPSGKLTTSFPRSTGSIPTYYNHKNTGRPSKEDDQYSSKYIDELSGPLFPFGFGLSYTNFKYSEITLDKNQISLTGKLTATIKIQNSGNYDGEEVVQLYTRQMSGSVARPVKELKGFKKIFLKAGESTNIDFTISADDLKFYNIKNMFVAEPSDVKIFIGGNSRDVKEAGFKLTE